MKDCIEYEDLCPEDKAVVDKHKQFLREHGSEWDNKYRALRAGEIIQKGDEIYDAHGWKDYGVWRPAKAIGSPAPDPLYPAHRMYRRLSDL